MVSLLAPQIARALPPDSLILGPETGPDGTQYEVFQFGGGIQDWAQAYSDAQEQTLVVNSVTEYGSLAQVTTPALYNDVANWVEASAGDWAIVWVGDYVDNNGTIYSGDEGSGTPVSDTSWVSWYNGTPSGGGFQGVAVGGDGYGSELFASSSGGVGQYVVAFAPVSVPEPSTLALFLMGGFAGLRMLRRRK